MILDHDSFLSCFKKEDVLWTRWDLGSKWNRIKLKLQTSLLILVFLKKEFSILERRITPPYAKNKTVVCATFPSLFQKYPVSKKRRGFRLRLASDSDRTARHEIILPVNYIFIPVKNQGSNVGWIRIEGEGKPRVLRSCSVRLMRSSRSRCLFARFFGGIVIQAGLDEANWTRLRNSGSSRFPRCRRGWTAAKRGPWSLLCQRRKGPRQGSYREIRFTDAHALAGVGRILREYFHSDSSSSWWTVCWDFIGNTVLTAQDGRFPCHCPPTISLFSKSCRFLERRLSF